MVVRVDAVSMIPLARLREALIIALAVCEPRRVAAQAAHRLGMARPIVPEALRARALRVASRVEEQRQMAARIVVDAARPLSLALFAFVAFLAAFRDEGASSSTATSGAGAPPLFRSALQRLLQHVTSSQQRSHFLRQVNGLWHTTHTLVGRFSFLTPCGIREPRPPRPPRASSVNDLRVDAIRVKLVTVRIVASTMATRIESAL